MHTPRLLRSLSAKVLAFASMLCLMAAGSAKADVTQTVTLTGANGDISIVGTCTPGTSGTLFISSAAGSAGDMYLALPSNGPDYACYTGGLSAPWPYAQTPPNSPIVGTYIPGLTGEGTPAQLLSLSTGWYAENGAMCFDAGGSDVCTGSWDSTNGPNSGDIDVLVNQGATTATYTIYSNTGAVDGTAQCGGNSLCFEDFSSGGSITFALNAPPPTPEPRSLLLFGTGMLCLAGLLNRRSRKQSDRAANK